MVQIRNDDVKPTLTWEFGYTEFGFCDKSNNFLTSVNYPTGRKERVEYDRENGMAFVASGPSDKMPFVKKHIIDPESNQPRIVSQWSYTSNNYLGNQAVGITEFTPNKDPMLHSLLEDYEYGSTEELLDENGDVCTSTTRRYNSFHLLISELSKRSGRKYLRETEYYAEEGKSFEQQPDQYAFPKKLTESWFNSDDSPGRSMITHFEFDENGNLTRNESPDGTVTEYIYYNADGEGGYYCPPEPNGFTRFIKKQILTPPKISGNENARETFFKWERLNASRGDGYSVVLSSSEKTFGWGQIRTDYFYRTGRNDPEFYENIDIETTNITPMPNVPYGSYTNEKRYSYSKSGDTIIESCEFFGFDHLQSKISITRHLYTGLVLSETSEDGIKTRHEYDKLGAEIKRITNADTGHEQITSWKHDINSQGLCTVITDMANEQTKVQFDGLGRVIKQNKFDERTGFWYDLFSCDYDTIGGIASTNSSDWLTEDERKRFPLTADITYDGWGEKEKVKFSDGREVFSYIDLVNLTKKDYTMGKAGRNTLTTGTTIQTMDNRSLLPVSVELKDNNEQLYSSTHYTFDGLGQLTKEQDELGRITERTFDEFGRVKKIKLPDGSTLQRTYAPHLTGNQVTSIKVTGKNYLGEDKTWVLGNQTFDSLGRLTKTESGGRTTTYTYKHALKIPEKVTLPSGTELRYTFIPEIGNAITSITTEGELKLQPNNDQYLFIILTVFVVFYFNFQRNCSVI